jgi:iron complex outermembrane receptor protein
MNRRLRYGCRLFVLVFCLAFFAAGPAQLHAQQNASTTLTGSVVDPVGGAVQNAAVVARNESSGAESKSVTDAQGQFSIQNLPAGTYTVEVSAPGFAVATRSGVRAFPERTETLSISLALGSVSEAITVEANSSGSIAAQHAPMDGLLEARSARTEVTPVFIQNFTSPEADFGELVEMAPGTFSIDPNGVGLGQDKTFFRGFPDGDYDIDFDGVPFYDTNTPTHHTWAFFPSPWVGSVDFDRSPGSASSVGPTPFGGAIHLLSPDLTTAPLAQFSVSYGSFNTLLLDGSYDSGLFWNKKSNVLVDVQHATSDGYETYNYQTRNAGSLKYIYKFSENNTLTGYSGVVWLDSNTPNNPPTRGQITQFGDNFLLTNDFNAGELNGSGACLSSTSCFFPLNYKFYTYHVPTDVEYVDWSKSWGAGWQTDFRPYTLSYYNAQYYNNPSFAANGIAFTGSPVSATSAVDKLNSYRKYGQTFTASQVSKWGILRTGLWYEWATTNRYQIPSNPLTRADTPLPNFHERFFSTTAQPFIEYEFRATQRLTITGGFKYAYFAQNLNQYQDNGKIVGCLGGKLVGGKTGTCVGGVPSVVHTAGYNAYLPSADANYRIRSNWSVYAQYGTGTIVPPSSVFDVASGNTVLLPKPTGVTTYQAGTVLKLKQVTLNADFYRTRFQNAFSPVTDPNNQTATDFIAAGDAVTKGVEGEANVYITRGISFYVNGTAGSAKYVSSTLPNALGAQVPNVNYEKWVQDTPSNTEAFGMTYQQKHFELGIFDKRIGPMWFDNSPYNQVIPIAPFSLTNVYLNYTLANGSRFAPTKLRLSVNNLFDNHNVVGVTQAAAGPTYQPGGADLLTTLPGRSVTMTVTLGYAPKR